MDTEQFKEILENTGVDVEEGYSGRGMYGKTCLSFTVEDIRDVIEVAVEAAFDVAADEDISTNEFKWAMCGAKLDNLGHEWVVYFPHFKTEKKGKEEE